MLGCTPFFRCMKDMFTAEAVADDHSSLLISWHLNAQIWELLTNLFLVLGNYDDKCTE
jgi:hypothetical protein